MLRSVNQILVFITEVIMVGAFGYVGFEVGDTTLSKYGLAMGIPLIAIVLWGYWAAPKSTHRLPMPYVALFRVVMFLVASAALYAVGSTTFAVTMAILSVVTQGLTFLWEDE